MRHANAPILGIDVSKHKLDVALLVDRKLRSKVVANSPKGYGDLAEWLGKQKAVFEVVCACMHGIDWHLQ
jgi:transposase